MAYVLKAGRGFILIANEYRYQKNKVLKDTIHWRCCKYRTCEGKIKTNKFDVTQENPAIEIREVRVFIKSHIIHV